MTVSANWCSIVRNKEIRCVDDSLVLNSAHELAAPSVTFSPDAAQQLKKGMRVVSGVENIGDWVEWIKAG